MLCIVHISGSELWKNSVFGHALDLNSGKEEAFAYFQNDDEDITIGGCYFLKITLEKREFDEEYEFCKTWMTQYLLKKLQPMIVALQSPSKI